MFGPAQGSKLRKVFISSLRLAALLVLGFLAVLVLGDVDDLRTNNKQAVERVSNATMTEAPEVRQAAFDQRFDLQQNEASGTDGLNIDRGPETQAKRKMLLQRLTKEEVFIKAELPGGLPSVWVGPTFYSLDFETKQEMVSIVFSYYLDGSDPIAAVRIFDGQTNKEIGGYKSNSPDGIRLRLF